MRACYCISVVGLFLSLAMSAQAQETEVQFRKLSAPETIGGILCGPTGNAKAGQFATGSLESCPLASGAVVQGNTFTAMTWVYFDKGGALRRAWLARDTKLQGHPCKGTGYKGWSVEFYPSGRLKLCFLATDEVIQGVPCKKGSFIGELTGGVFVRFHENGNLESCAASRKFAMGSRQYNKRERVWLSADGVVVEKS